MCVVWGRGESDVALKKEVRKQQQGRGIERRRGKESTRLGRRERAMRNRGGENLSGRKADTPPELMCTIRCVMPALDI